MPKVDPNSARQRALAAMTAIGGERTSGECTARDVASTMGISSADAARIIGNLLQSGWVVLVPGSSPKRYRVLAGDELAGNRQKRLQQQAAMRLEVNEARRKAASAATAWDSNGVPIEAKRAPHTPPAASRIVLKGSRDGAGQLAHKAHLPKGQPVVDIRGDMKPKGEVDYSRAKLTVIPAPEHMGEGQRWRYSANSPEATRLQDEWKRLRGEAGDQKTQATGA